MTKFLSWLVPALMVGLLFDPDLSRARDLASYELTDAASAGDLARVKQLHASGVDIESTDGSSTALTCAAISGRTEVVRYLIEQGAKLEARSTTFGFTPLTFAILNDHFDTAQLLVAKGARLDAEGDYHHSPLHTAIENKRFDIAKWLLRQGANPNLHDWRGNTALMEVVDNPDMLRFLIRMGADVNVKQDQGQTALAWAISGKYLQSVRILLRRGARQHLCRWDESAVMVAVKDGTPEILRLLLRYHPWLEARNHGPSHWEPGQTALEIALEMNNHEAARILQGHGARKVTAPETRGPWR
jgi:ankyrin repeat protein